jgi:hypothetical protein
MRRVRHRSGILCATLFALLVCGSARAAVVWPSNDNSWNAFQTGSPAADYYDPNGPAPNAVDIIGLSSGGTSYPAAYWYDDTANDNIYFRIRLNGDPTTQQGFGNYSWQIVLDTNLDNSVDWALQLVSSGGGTPNLGIYAATVGGPTWGQVTLSSTPSWYTTSLSTDVRATDIGANIDPADNKNDWFLDLAVPFMALYAVTGLQPGGAFRAAVTTSTTHTAVNKDLPGSLGTSSSVSGGWSNDLTTSLNHSPEPGTLALFGLGGLAGSWYLRRRNRKGAAARRAP